MRDQLLAFLGLCAKAGKLKSGEFSVEQAIKKKSAFLVLVAEDASDLTKKRYLDSCHFYDIPILYYGTKDSLGKAIGKELRASVAILDENFADALIDKYNLTKQ